MPIKIATFLLGVTLLAAPAQASDPLPGRMPGLRLPPSLQRPTGALQVGHWAEYSIHDKRMKRRIRLHMALVGKRGRTYWWEMTFRQARLPALRLKILVLGKITSPEKIKRVIVQTGTQRAVELPLKQGQRMVDMYVRRSPTTRIQDRGVVQLKTAAGRFSTRHIVWNDKQGNKAEEWTSKAALLWGLVRYRGKRFEMELIGQGKGARSRVRGVPAKWHIPGL